MSTKICMSAWNGGPWETKDTVTLGQLEQMIAALYVLGYDINTPATYLFDDEHVWLEAVEFDNPRDPRIWSSLDDVPRDVKVTSAGGQIWTFWTPGMAEDEGWGSDGVALPGEWLFAGTGGMEPCLYRTPPFTEVVE